MQDELPVFAMNGHDVGGTQQVDHQFQLFLGGVTRNMHIGDRLVKHLRALAEQVIDGAIHHLFVAWNRGSGENNCIVWLDAHLAMVLVGDTCEGRGWLPLTARANDHYALRRKLVDILGANEHPFRKVQVAKLNRHLYVIHHTAAYKSYYSFVTRGGIHYLLHA